MTPNPHSVPGPGTPAAPARAGDGEDLDLAAYLDRLGLGGRVPEGTALEVLTAVHRAHLVAVPFENIDPVAGTVPSLALADIQDKLIRRRRGGYCFEQNTLLAAALEALGFSVRRLAARVVLGTDRFDSRPLTHMALLVEVEGEPLPYLADVGFGTIGALPEPVPLTVDAEHHAHGRRHRLARTRAEDASLDTWVLQAYGPDGWVSQYVFTTEPVPQPDRVLANWYVATHPRSPFNRRLGIQHTTHDRHYSLFADEGGARAELTVTYLDGRTEVRVVTGTEDVLRCLVEDMGLPQEVLAH
ncbi:arylamine N-acetyltransferase [Streptomyces sp. NPDC007088]|uniref:arylamine N-acetyltransferase family protein n=1 Tax=Streptomyces sp. NPDC007088 TaxID=3364773 RepID=UPI00367916F8